MPEGRRELARIAIDLGLDQREPTAKKQRCRPWRRAKQPDFCALFAADGLRQLEAYLANWAAHNCRAVRDKAKDKHGRGSGG